MADHVSMPRLSDALSLREWRHRLALVIGRLLASTPLSGPMLARAERRTRTQSATLERAATPAAAADAEPKIVPPTPTDDPDSIVGGSPTSDFPDCCAVGNDDGWFCTGTLIAPNLVVTAGHCHDDNDDRLQITRVFLKGPNVANPASGEVFNVKENHAHPSADLRVLVLDVEDRKPSVNYRKIAQGAEANASTATLVGFGTIDFDGSVGYGIKRRVDVPITSIDCSAAGDQSTFGCKPGIEMVAGQRGLALDSCRGDSGGPLYIRNVDDDVFLLGATSRGVSNAGVVCGDGGIYVRVDQFIDWITEKTGVSI
ncbi:MAG: secreted trypsin-like serine protease [Thermomicrobiales bacterium]|nr:secreted trypsin-like serine protease [Thermomicrobiales bacterium]